MNVSADTAEERKRRSVAREYERNGYRVTIPGRDGDLPAFLEGFEPDLIAESDHDRVIIEVKRSDAVRGSNDLLKIAERVSREPGWRFELITIPSTHQVSVPLPEGMASIEAHVHKAVSLGLTDAAYLFASAAVEELLNDLAMRHGLKVKKMPFLQTVRELVSMGAISEEALEIVNHARVVRNRLVHTKEELKPSVAEIEQLLAFERSLRSELTKAAAD